MEIWGWLLKKLVGGWQAKEEIKGNFIKFIENVLNSKEGRKRLKKNQRPDGTKNSYWDTVKCNCIGYYV